MPKELTNIDNVAKKTVKGIDPKQRQAENENEDNTQQKIDDNVKKITLTWKRICKINHKI